MSGGEPGIAWTPDDVRHLATVRELEIAAPRRSGEAGPWTPIWVVVVDDEVYVRTWHRRTTGWYGRAVSSARARIRVAGAPVEVTVTVTGETDADAIAAAYRAKYGAGGAQSMITAEAAASTLRLTRRI